MAAASGSAGVARFTLSAILSYALGPWQAMHRPLLARSGGLDVRPKSHWPRLPRCESGDVQSLAPPLPDADRCAAERLGARALPVAAWPLDPPASALHGSVHASFAPLSVTRLIRFGPHPYTSVGLSPMQGESEDSRIIRSKFYYSLSHPVLVHLVHCRYRKSPLLTTLFFR